MGAFFRRPIDMRIVLSVVAASLFGLGGAQPVPLPLVSARGGAVVLARVVAVKDAAEGVTWRQSSPSQKESCEWKTVVLERMDVFAGSAPERLEVAVARGAVEESNFLANPPKTGGYGYSGPGPVEGLQVGDVSVWTLQRPSEGGIYRQDAFSPSQPSDGDWVSLTAPGSQFIVPPDDYRPIFIAGKTLMGLRRSSTVPAYDKSLPPLLRYADLLAGSTLDTYTPGWLSMSSDEAGTRLRDLPKEVGTDSPGAGVSRADLDAWFEKRVAARWPRRNDVDRANLLALRMIWGQPNLEPTFLALLKKVPRKDLFFGLPPIQSETFYVEECESDDPAIACEGFDHVRHSKNLDRRVLRAAKAWLATGLQPPSDDLATTMRSCGLFGTIFWYLADNTGNKDLVAHWTEPKAEDLTAASAVVDDLLTKKG